jgi:serine/threonine protein kinase/tetratricopeptide (TPR) repeat protein
LRGKYRLIDELGRGPHAISFLAEHEYLSHSCVVKVLPQRAGETSDAAIRRLRDEARAGFQVNDPNVVRVLDCDVTRGNWYFVMEYVDGVDLAEPLRSGARIHWRQAVAVARDAAQGLAAIHRLGITHRDIKPANLLLGVDGRVRVADLGVAGLAHDPASARGGGPEMLGTLPYAAPETFEAGEALGPQADLFSLGATVFHLVTGRLPHEGGQVFRRLIDLQCRTVEWPADQDPATPDWFVSAILKTLHPEWRERCASAEALLADLNPPAEEPRAPVPVSRPEVLEPRGLGVLPFENARQSPDDDWLGYALANHLSRSLSELSDAYVTDQDGLMAALERVMADGEADRTRSILVAGRRVGAGTVLAGRFERAGQVIAVTVEAFQAGRDTGQVVARVQGALTELDELQRQLLRRVLQSMSLAERVAETARGSEHSPVLGAREKLVLARQSFLRADYEWAIRLAREAVALDPDFAEAIGFVGICSARVGSYDDAESYHRRQHELALRWGDRRLEVEALANLGVMYYFRGDYESAERRYSEAAERARAMGLAVEEAHICNNLGFVLFRRGRPAEAEKAFHRAIETHRAYGGLTPLIGPYNGMGNVLLEQGRFRDARSYYRRALALAQEIGDRASVGTTHMHLARCAAQEERFAEAKHEFTMALNALEETRFWNGLARAYEYMAEMNNQLGHYEEAVRCADKRIELARQHSNARIESAAWRQKAESLKKAGRVDEAATCFAEARRAEASLSSS